MVDVESPKLTGAWAGVIGDCDYHLVMILKTRRHGVGETRVPHLVDLYGVRPNTSEPFCRTYYTIYNTFEFFTHSYV